ncbi:MAG: hypothetical protein AAGU21_18960 [Solidesulfovibrio sp.]|uniref:hypothetical protein n=1 Tax=Solidesulfovibrio sp. TaxID=2910990 RepID=UPI002B202E29|nr:hypothetical protein [Solidesulfovibrio sp.]MEA4858357.1 hypothetical protein [Solidesulfovibrio sp.]
MFPIRCLVLATLLCILPTTVVAADILDFLPSILVGVDQTKSRINVFSTGPGSFFSSDNSLSYNYDTGQGTTSKMFVQNNTSLITLTAIPKAGAAVATWEGCQSVSDDNMHCTVPLSQDRNVFLHFATPSITYKDVTVVDVTGATVVAYGTAYTLTARVSDTALAQKIQGLGAGDYVVNKGEPSFFRRVVSVTPLGSGIARIETESCTLEDIIASGTIYISKKMTHADLAAGTASLVTAGEGMRLKPAAPDSTVFTIQFGDPAQSSDDGGLAEGCLELNNAGGVTAKLCGEIDVELNLVTSQNYEYFQLKQFTFVPEVKSTERLTIKVTGSYLQFSNKRQLAELVFAKIFSGPVWTDCSIAFALELEGSLSSAISFSGSMNTLTSAGLTYDADRSPAWDIVNTATVSHQFDQPQFSLATGKAKAALSVSPKLKFMSATGPSFDISPFFELKGDYGLISACEGFAVKADVGIGGTFSWDFSGDTTIGKFLDLDELQQKATFTIGNYSRTVKQWSMNSDCANEDKLDVDGDNLYLTHTFGSSRTYTQQFLLKNDDDSVVNWSFSGIPGVIGASPAKGTIDPHSSVAVNVTVSPQQFGIGLVDKAFSFKIAQKTFKRNAHIHITRSLITSSGLHVYGWQYGYSDYSITANWNLSEEQLKDVLGFEVYESTDAINYHLIACIGNKYVQTFTANIYPPGTKHWYYISFYGVGGSRADKFFVFQNFTGTSK